MAKKDSFEKQNERRDRPGFHAKRVNKGHPRRQARRDRAQERISNDS